MLSINSEKAQSQISVYKSLHLSSMSVYDSWQSKTCASMTAEIFDVDHEANPTLGLYPWLWRTQFAIWMSVTLLHFWFSVLYISLSLFSPWEDRTKSWCQSISKEALVLSAQFWTYFFEVYNFEYIFCHLKFWIWPPSDFFGVSPKRCVLYTHRLCGKAILGESEVMSQYGGAQSVLLFMLL